MISATISNSGTTTYDHMSDFCDSLRLWHEHMSHFFDSLRLWHKHMSVFCDSLRLCHDRVSDLSSSGCTRQLWEALPSQG